jgi:hypothetical protein
MTAALSPQRTTHGRPHLQLVPTGRDVAGPIDVRGWLVTLAAVALVLMVAIGAVAAGRGAFAGAVPEAPVAEASGQTVTALPGDTLWTIARRVQPGTDVRALVDQLVALNGTALVAGQEVVLPA